MGAVYVQMLPLILGAALLPIWIIIVLMLLSGKGGLAKGAAFVGGVTFARLLQGVLFGLVFTGSGDAESDSSSGAIKATLLLVLGILLLVTAYKNWSKEPDPDAPPPKILASLADMSAIKALGLGIVLPLVAPKLWVFTLGAISVIDEANLGRTSSIIAYLLYMISAQLLITLPVLAYLVAPAWAASSLGAAREWLEKHNRVIVIVVSLIFGLLFLWQGVTGLMG
jgi:hypothetical protein